MNKEMQQNDNADARTSARQSVYKLYVEWQDVQKSLVTIKTSQEIPADYDSLNVLKVCFYGDFPALKILEAGGIDIHDNNDETLRFAARGGQVKMVNYLLDNNADIHAVGDSALQLAALAEHFEIVDLLKERGANLNKLNADQKKSYDDYKAEEKRHQEKLAVIYKTWQAEKKLTAVFNAKTWAGHTNEMTVLWDKIPEPLKNGIDFPHLVAEAQHEYSRQNKPKKPVFIR